jgi:hypothetical protein
VRGFGARARQRVGWVAVRGFGARARGEATGGVGSGEGFWSKGEGRGNGWGLVTNGMLAGVGESASRC